DILVCRLFGVKVRQAGMPVLPLEVQLKSKLKLSRIEDGSRLAIKPAVARALVERVYIAKQRRCSCFIETIEKVEALRNQVEPHILAQSNAAHHAQIERCVAVRNTCVATKCACGKCSCRYEQRTIRCHARPIRRTLQIAVRIRTGQK